MPSLVLYKSCHLLNVFQFFLLSFFKAYGILVSWKKKRTTPFHILSKTYIYLCETFISCDHIFIWCNQPIPVWFRFDSKVVILSMTYTLSLSTPWKPISLKWPVLILLIHLYCSPTVHSPGLSFGVCLCICYHPHFKLSLDFCIIGVSAPDLYRYFLYLSIFWYLFLDFTGFFLLSLVNRFLLSLGESSHFDCSKLCLCMLCHICAKWLSGLWFLYVTQMVGVPKVSKQLSYY